MVPFKQTTKTCIVAHFGGPNLGSARTWCIARKGLFLQTACRAVYKSHPEGSEGPKGGRRKGGRGRKLSHFLFCCAFRCCVVYSPCLPVWGEEKVMTIYDAGPLAAGPLCGLLKGVYELLVFLLNLKVFCGERKYDRKRGKLGKEFVACEEGLSRESEVLISLRVWAFHVHTLYILSLDDLDDFSRAMQKSPQFGDYPFKR